MGILVTNRPSPNYDSSPLQRVDYIVIHATAGSKIKSTLDFFASQGSRSSAHCVIDTNGDRYNCVDLRFPAWHAGGQPYGKIQNMNFVSWGVELVNSGPLWWSDQHARFEDMWFHEIPFRQVEFFAYDQSFQLAPFMRFPELQIQSLIDWIVDVRLNNLLLSPQAKIVMHKQINLKKPNDPSPAFPYDLVLKDVAYRCTNAELNPYIFEDSKKIKP